MKKPNYKCNDCGHLFDEPIHIRDEEIMDYGIGRRWVTLFEGEVCPECESNKFEPIFEEENEE